MIFVDASAMVSIIAEESDGEQLTERLQRDGDVVTSAIAVWETVAALCFRYEFRPPDARERAALLMKALGFRLVAIAENETVIALAAYEAFGKGRHKAALNMGDCFAYACAKANGARLLFKGDDFTLTDIEAA